MSMTNSQPRFKRRGHRLTDLVVALALVTLLGSLQTSSVDGAGGKDVSLRFGFGCAFSDYAAMSSNNGGGSADTPSFRMLFDFGQGKGVFTLHFTSFHLPDTDFVLLRAKNVDKSSPDAKVLAGRNTTGGFFSSPIVGDGFILELYQPKTSSSVAVATTTPQSVPLACFGVEVNGMVFAVEKQAEAAQANQLAIGLPQLSAKTEQAQVTPTDALSKTPRPNQDTDNESLCGEDESKEAVCLEQSSSPEEQTFYRKSRAVARLTIRKDNSMNIAYCTGFLLGCEGHVITNQHCIRNWLDALNTYVEFFAEASMCGSKACDERGACPGRLLATRATLTAVSTDLDYALIKLSSDNDTKSDISSFIAQVGEYLQLRASGPKLEEEVYIPQHPLGQGKRIAWTASGKPGRIESLTAGECGGNDAGYYIDTQEGSSGSPVIAKSDNAVVALHHCGGCLNGGILSQKLIADLETKGVLPRCAIAP